MFTNQSHNAVDGDLVAGDKVDSSKTTIINVVTNGAASEELAKLYEKLKADGIGDSSNGKLSEKLEHYMSATTNGDVRGLEAKLRDSGRLDQLRSATDLKERAFKSIMKHQTSRTAQRVYTIVLSELHAAFTLTVTPVIQQDGDRVAVDKCINAILQATRNMLGENVLEFDLMDLLALLYYLGGNCHIRWDKC
ncbi:ABC-three component system protein [Ralstonia nicotianae]